MVSQDDCKFDLISIAKKGGNFPAYISLLFHSANRGDEASLAALIADFFSAIKQISAELQCEYELSDEVTERLRKTAVKTLRDFMHRHHEPSFPKFIVWAFRANMIYKLAN